MARASTCVRRRSSASARWSAPGSSRCSVQPARSRVPRCGSRSSSPARSRCCRATRSPSSASRYPSAGGLLEYVRQGYGDGHVTGVVAWLLLTANAIITAMVAVSFGSYASSAVTDGDETWGKVFAVAVIVVMAGLNVVGSKAVARAQTVVVVVVIGILTIFAVATISTIDADLLDPSGYPSVADIVAQRGPDVLRVLGLRRDHVHGEGPGRPAAPAAARHVPRARDRHGDLCGRGAWACSAR